MKRLRLLALLIITTAMFGQQPVNVVNTPTVSVSNFPGTQPVSGTVTANEGGAPWTMKPDGTVWTLTSTSANVNVTNTSLAVTGTFWQATQPVSGTVTANEGGAPWTVTGTLSDNGAAATSNHIATVPGIYQTDYNNGTAGTQGRDSAQNHGTDGLLWAAQLPAIRPASYHASTIWSPVATSATDIFRMPGNASNTVLVTSLRFSCTATTAGVQKVSIIKRSTAGSGGTSANVTVVPMDSTYAAGVSVPVSYTANPTVGTAVGDIDDVWMGMMATGTTTPNDLYIGNFRQKPIVLRGVAENLVINLNSASIAGISCSASVEWIETKTITP